MATKTGTFTIHPPGRVRIDVGGKIYEHSFTGSETFSDPVLATVIDEYLTNDTLSGTITITAA